MNFYKRHLGDIAKSCAHLSQGAMGAYDLLLDWHYANEQPLPLDKGSLYRIGRAFTKAEKANVDAVLVAFFERTEAGYVQGRAIQEMDKANTQAETNRRIAEEREARRRAAREARNEHESCDDSEHEACTNRQPSHKPLAKKEQKQEQFQASMRDLASADPPAGPPAGLPVVTPPAIPTDAGIACRLMREAGCTQTNPGHRDLLAALAEGCTPAELAATAAEAIAAGVRKPFPWAIATARGRRAEGPKPAPTGAPRHDHHHRGSRCPSLAERAQQHEREAHAREAAAAARRADGDPLAPDDRGLRPPLDGCARRVG